MLERAGHRVVSAGDGREALSCLQTTHGAGRLPALIITDMNMPNLNGWQLIEAVHRDPRFSAIPIVVLSGASLGSLEGLAVVALLVKPLTSLNALLAAVAEHATPTGLPTS